MTPLFPYQEEGVEKSLKYLKTSSGWYYGSDPGLGKTLMTLKAIPAAQTLIICPAVVRYVWRDEIKKWGYGNSIVALKAKDIGLERFSIISYEATLKEDFRERIKHLFWHTLILDEVHKIKNRTAKRTKFICGEIWRQFKLHVCLSGTPFTDSVADCWTVFNKFCPNEFPDYYSFGDTFAKTKMTPWGPKYYGIENAEVLNKIIKHKFFFRYRKEEVLKDLPDVLYTKIPLGKEFLRELTDDEYIAHKTWVKILQENLTRGLSPPTPPISSQKIRREQGLLKIPAIEELILEFIANDTPCVVFVYHNEVIEKLTEKLKEYKPQVIYGKTSPEQRRVAIENFQSGVSNLFLASITAAGLGITLTRSSICILGEFDYSANAILQAIARLHRIGQKNNVHVIYPVVEGSIEEDIVKIAMDKDKAFNTVFNE